jgi:predicted DNA-binding transcriptional regulator AlpA
MTQDSPIKDETRKRLGLLTEEELCSALDNKPATLQQWRCEGYGPKWVKLGKAVFYRFSDVEDWINRSVCESVKDVPNAEVAPQQIQSAEQRVDEVVP